MKTFKFKIAGSNVSVCSFKYAGWRIIPAILITCVEISLAFLTRTIILAITKEDLISYRSVGNLLVRVENEVV